MRCCKDARRVDRAWAVLALLFALVAGFAWAAADIRAALEQARDALQKAAQARPEHRPALLQRAKGALAPLPYELRDPLERQIADAQASNDLDKLHAAQATVEAYLNTLRSRSPSLAPPPAQVRQQLDQIFAEPDMFVPPKSWLERLSEVFQQALDNFVRWLSRFLGALGGSGVAGAVPFLQWLIIVLLVVAIALAISYVVGRIELPRRRTRTTGVLDALVGDARAMSALEWQALAQQLAQSGDWRLAIRAYYLALLRLLHEAKLLDYDPAQTNWEHLEQLRRPPLALPPALTNAPALAASLREEAYRLLRPLTLHFDALWYGNRSPTPDLFAEFERAFETLHAKLKPYAVVA